LKWPGRQGEGTVVFKYGQKNPEGHKEQASDPNCDVLVLIKTFRWDKILENGLMPLELNSRSEHGWG
jgi:hypothetical protein